MKVFGKFLGRVLLSVLGIGCAMAFLGPYEKISVQPDFDASAVGDDVDVYFATQEARFNDLIAGVEKRVIWALGKDVKTDLAIVYVHGFSATSEEIRPVPDRVAKELGANLVFTRLNGHGRDGAALANARVQDWVNDVSEVIEIARITAEEVVLIATSTGGTVVAAMLDQEDAMRDVKGAILISPNFGINDPLAPLLTLPAARQWVPILGGKERSWTPQNEDHGQYWTTSYPSTAIFQMAALVKHAAEKDYSSVDIPTLFWFSDADKVVSAKVTRDVLEGWGGTVTISQRDAEAEGMDPNAHVIAGDILSPGQNGEAVRSFVKFISGLEK
ncbi:alpha/beta hydrolase [Shimia abyssi]|uniref:Alpha-beta hydrolase superfamily lysophospholipase n=1 Tax=Shimia abyssi TaxID=1662395 RepID=A0A2P8FJ93_9RHOB|nr:alpha/beta fold hydrolase [Shimia abyssi]PSL21785.1 alpha-beta hydrolase superfamily lysophospholipase [Shimia abyssi]